MAGFVKKWMIANSLHDEPVPRDPRAWRASREGGDYARELRDLSQRLRDEAPMDLEWPEHRLRHNTLRAVRECYILRQRRKYGRWSIHATVSPRLITTLAACVLFAGSASLAIHQGGPELFDSVRNVFTQPHHVVTTGPEKNPSSTMAGVSIGDGESIAGDSGDNGRSGLGLALPGDDHQPKHADISDNDSSRSTPAGNSP